ncbi:MAG: VWA domain-containing protein [Betaproteobacteria bacterium]|nr:VWA domain-containing protein [Betaproteobacteria bacterium]
MELAAPLWLLLLPLPLVWGALAWRSAAEGEPQSALPRHPGLSDLDAATPPGPRLPVLLTALGFALLVLALAQPRQIGVWITPPPEGRDIALVIDTSLTMSIDDFEQQGRKVARLTVLKAALARFVAARPHDRIGLLAFGAEAATLTPPTFDHAHVQAQLARLQVGMAGENTALGDALGLALKDLKQHRLRPAILLASDGEPSNTGDMTPAEAVAVARQLGAAIHTLQVGSDLFAAGRSAPPPEADPQPGLADIARLTGGQYAQARDANDVETMIRAVDRHEKTLARPARERETREWYLLPLLLGASSLTLARVLALRGGRA